MTPEELLALAQEAFDANPEALDEIVSLIDANAIALGFAVSPVEGGGLGNAFRNRIDAAKLREQAEMVQRVEDRPFGANALSTAANAAMMGLLPDFLDMLGRDGEGMRTLIEENREVRPAASMVASGAGIVSTLGLGGVRLAAGVGRGLLGVGTRIAARGATRTGRAIASPLATAAVVGAGAGSGGGGLLNFAEAHGEPFIDRLRAFGEGATSPVNIGVGAAAGPVLGFLGSRGRRLFGGGPTGPRVAQELREATGRSGNLVEARGSAQARVNAAKEGLDAVERNTPEILSDDLEVFINDLLDRPDVAGHVRTASREVAAGTRFSTVADMRRLQTNLRKAKRFAEVEELTDILGRDVPGFRGAQAEFRRTSLIREAIELGETGSGRTFDGVRIKTNTADNMAATLDALAPDAVDAFSEGVIARTLNPIDRRFTGGKLSNLKRLAENADGNGAIRRMFPDDAAANAFIQGIEKDLSAAQLRKLFTQGTLVALGVGSMWALGRSGAEVFEGNP